MIPRDMIDYMRLALAATQNDEQSEQVGDWTPVLLELGANARGVMKASEQRAIRALYLLALKESLPQSGSFKLPNKELTLTPSELLQLLQVTWTDGLCIGLRAKKNQN